MVNVLYDWECLLFAIVMLTACVTEEKCDPKKSKCEKVELRVEPSYRGGSY